MPSERRREAILDAVCVEVVEREMDMTTKELAALAGVAEGTLFRVFGSKEELLIAAFTRRMEQVAMDDSWRSQLAVATGDGGVNLSDLDAQLAAYIDIVTGRISCWTHLLSVLHRFLRGTEAEKARNLRESTRPEMQHIKGLYMDALRSLADTCRELLEPHRDELRCDVDQSVAFIQATATSLALGAQFHDFGLNARQVADITLHGILGSAGNRSQAD